MGRYEEPSDSVLAFLNVFPDAVLVFDEAGAIVMANSAAQSLFGREGDSLAGRPVGALLPPTLLEAGGRASHADCDGEIHDGRGERLYVEIKLCPLRHGGRTLTVATLRDVSPRVAAQRTLVNISERTFRRIEQDFFQTLAHTLADELKADYITIARIHPDDAETAATIAFLERGALGENIRYPLAGTPCDTTVKDHQCMVLEGLQEAYPEDTLLVDMGVHAYVGVRMFTSSGEVCGLINAIFAHPLTGTRGEMALSLLKIVALRAAPEVERLETEKLLKKLSMSVELSPIAVAITDKDANLEYVNPTFCELTGYSQDECLGRDQAHDSAGNTPRHAYAQLWDRILAGGEWQGELENRRKDGSVYWARTRIFPITGAAGEITNFVSIQEDISRDKQLTRRLEYEATHDQLTDLVNRREFERRLQETLQSARDTRAVHSLCFLDLDQFKVLNDNSGHVAGDILLRKVGELLKGQMRVHDTAARLGGDEFGLLLLDCPASKAGRILDQVRAAIKAINFIWEGKAYSIGVSIGVTEINGQVRDPVELMKQVDTACYTAKERGKDQVHFYREDNEAIHRLRREIDWVPEINAALAEDRIHLYGQPVVPIHPQARLPMHSYYEVLIRLQDAAGNLVPPSQFLPAVERYRLSAQLDRYVIDKVFAWIRAHRPAVSEVSGIAVNLSGASIGDPELLEYVIDCLEREVVPPEKVKFEITETTAISNIIEARHFMKKIREAGSQIALDDFGSGLSSFSYLKNLPVDILKIDGLLVREVAIDRSSYVMVKMINEMAHSLGIRTVAEFVENDEILHCLEKMGFDYAQGYEIARPGPLKEVLGRVGEEVASIESTESTESPEA